MPEVQQAVEHGRQLQELMREAGQRYLVGSEERTRPGPSFRKKGKAEMIEPRYRQQTLYEQAVESFMPDQKKLLWEGWMLKVDELLEKDELVEIVHRGPPAAASEERDTGAEGDAGGGGAAAAGVEAPEGLEL